MHIRELTKRTGIPERQVRYLISEGLVPAPRGGRSNADYGDDHIKAIGKYKRLRELGFPPAAIKLLLKSSAGVPFPVDRGITLVIAPDLIGSGKPVPPLAEQVKKVLQDTLKETSSDNTRK